MTNGYQVQATYSGLRADHIQEFSSEHEAAKYAKWLFGTGVPVQVTIQTLDTEPPTIFWRNGKIVPEGF